MTKKSPDSRYVAFLRGINVGGHRVKMDDLRGLFEKLKLSDVSTFIASGNVVFRAPAMERAEAEKRIEAFLEHSLGYAVPTFLRTPTEVAAVLVRQPFAADEAAAAGHTVHVAFLREALSREAVRKLVDLRTAIDEFRPAGREFFWLCRGRFADSLVRGRSLEKTIAMPSTMRNVTMLRRLVAEYPPPECDGTR